MFLKALNSSEIQEFKDIKIKVCVCQQRMILKCGEGSERVCGSNSVISRSFILVQRKNNRINSEYSAKKIQKPEAKKVKRL